MSFADWHALDAPFTDYLEWLRGFETGTCTACGQYACRGETRWWHDGGPLLCPARDSRRPSFSPDTEGPR